MVLEYEFCNSPSCTAISHEVKCTYTLPLWVDDNTRATNRAQLADCIDGDTEETAFSAIKGTAKEMYAK